MDKKALLCQRAQTYYLQNVYQHDDFKATPNHPLYKSAAACQQMSNNCIMNATADYKMYPI